MNLPRSIWSDVPLSTGIAAIGCYAGIFNDVISVDELASKLGTPKNDEFFAALDDLHLQGKLILKDGFVGLPNLEDKFASKISKIATTKRLIASRLDTIEKLGRNPLIKFVGISGSLAANNPTGDRNNRVDIDLFLITRNQCMWFYNIARGIRNLVPAKKVEPELCPNYIMDESNLLVPNRNFYTATEIRNLIPISGFEAHRKFLQVNSWVDYYYPGTSGSSAPIANSHSGNLINNFFYVLYATLRSIKWMNLEALRKISFKADLHGGINAHQLRPHYGGYQALVQVKFTRLARRWFPELLNTELIEKLFPDKLGTEIRRGDTDVVKICVAAGYDYSKYA